MASVQFPAQEALQRRRRFIYQRAAADLAEALGIVETSWLIVVEYVAFAIVSRSASKWLVTE